MFLLVTLCNHFPYQNPRSCLATDRNQEGRRIGGHLVIGNFGEVIGSFEEVIGSSGEVIGSSGEVIGAIEGIEMIGYQEEEEEDLEGEGDPQEIGIG